MVVPFGFPHYAQLNNVKKLPCSGIGGAVNIHPVFEPPFVEFAPAYHVAPPVATDLEMFR
jgi:hypothetical protein